jgi:putative transposase
MDDLIFNAVVRIESADLNGFYRVVATPPGNDMAWLAFMGPWQPAAAGTESAIAMPSVGSLSNVARAALEVLLHKNQLTCVDLQPTGHLLHQAVDLKEPAQKIWARRCEIAAPMLDHQSICRSLEETAGIGPLVRQAMGIGECARGSVYRLWVLLCSYGFDASSLNPKFSQCGAPGVQRPGRPGSRKVGAKTSNALAGNEDLHPQRQMCEEDNTKILHHYRRLMKPGLSLQSVYDQIIEAVYVSHYEQVGNKRCPILPPQGTFPNERQVRHLVEFGTKRLERVLLKTTQGHFDRNKRSLIGKSYDGVVGPGHLYAIDSTIGDVHLRSSINRAWLIGRPIVYLVVDMWSTAIVGFHVCLTGPSWNTAKLALFSTYCDPKLTAELWGYQYVAVLSPSPTIPAMTVCDRGEYLSQGARETCLALGSNFSFNPARRPDLKGLVEVLNRITKDKQYVFLPGAIDARRREIELKPDTRESALTLREYVHYLHGIFAHYNLFADRSHRMTAEMIGARVQPSPAGLWRFGHEVGIGYRKNMPQDRLITGLLERSTAVVRRDGVYLKSLQYEADIAHQQQWTGLARDNGVVEQTAYHFPGTVSRFWWPNPEGGLMDFRLRANARTIGETPLDDWLDALMSETMKKADRAYLRLEAAVQLLAHQTEQRKRSVELTRQAEEDYAGLAPNTREARSLENALSGAEQVNVSATASRVVVDQAAGNCQQYEALMTEVFDEMNREVAQ